jgi:hypothetical protein
MWRTNNPTTSIAGSRYHDDVQRLYDECCVGVL